MQPNIFFWLSGDPCPQQAQLNASNMDPCPFLRGYDYFQGSEVWYIYGCIILCSVPLLTIVAAYGVVKYMNSKRRKMKQIREENNNGKKVRVARCSRLFQKYQFGKKNRKILGVLCAQNFGGKTQPPAV